MRETFFARGALALVLAVVCATPAGAQPAPRNPYDADQQRHAREAERRGRSGRALLPILELWGQWEHASPGLTTRLLDRLRRSRRLSAPVRAYAGTLHAYALLREGDPDAAAREIEELGYVQRWRVIGPFDNEGKAGFEREFPPEAGRDEPVDLAAEHQGKVRAVRWRTYPEITRFGYVNFDAVLRPFENVCGFAETFVHSERARPLSLWVGAGGAVKVWVNGEEIVSDAAYRGPDPDRTAALVTARAGQNRVLVEVCVTDTAWGFYLRLAEPDGSPASGLRVDPEGADRASPAPAAPPRMPRAPAAPLAELERAVREQPESARAHHELAQLLSWTQADDPADRRAVQLAARACELDADAERCLLALGSSQERHERLRFMAEAEEVAPNDPRVRLVRAGLIMAGPDPEQALPLLEAIAPTSPEGIVAALARAGLYDSLGLGHTALAIIRDVAARTPGAPKFQRDLAGRVAAAGRADEAIALRRAVIAARWDDTALRQVLVSDALERGDHEEVLAHLDAMRAASPDDLSTLYYAAAIQDGLGREADALATHQEILALVPEDPDAHVAYGRRLLRHGQRDAGAAALRQALALRPQDAATRELLEQLRPTERPDEAWATATEDVLERRREQSRWPVTILHDLRVHSVFDNGLGSVFRQVAAQVHDAEGARRWRTYQIPFDPATQWVDVRSARVHRADGTVLESSRTYQRSVGSPGYRIYYDSRVLVVAFPDLEPGDTVELRYRVDDIAHRNVFDDYFGDLQILQGGDPIAHLEYVLLTPAARELYFNEPSLRGLRRERRVDGDRRIDRLVASDVPAIRSEQNMPGITEVAPYLHVSTYRTWEDVGRWWWGLVQDQLRPDESLERTVRDLVRDAPDTRTKVERIFHWVVTNTRYVGLEFGIHGFKPYRVTQVVRRGFGDCKDKASLLYAMLKLAGVDARIALVRTRRNGAIDDLPASLAVFDHAIAYVPELDLYLDGTAENSGTLELPSQDQGVMVLVVGPDGARRTTTPVLGADRDRRERSLVVDLSADGTAEVETEETVRGDAASQYRTAYQAENTRNERLQRSLAGGFPGLELLEHRFDDLADLEAPVRFTWRARVPQLARRDGDEMRVAPSAMEQLTRGLAPTPSRRHPVDLGAPHSYSERRVIRLPPGLEVRHLPSGGEARSRFGVLTVRYEREGGQIIATTVLEIAADRIPVPDYAGFRSWLEDADELLRERMTVGGAR